MEEAFAKFGQLKNCFVARNPGGFGFVEFENAQDAEDAVKALDGTVINGGAIRTEISHGKKSEKKKAWLEQEEKSHSFYGDYGSSSRRPRGYSPPRGRGSSSESEIRRLRDENARLRDEVDHLRRIIDSGKY